MPFCLRMHFWYWPSGELPLQLWDFDDCMNILPHEIRVVVLPPSSRIWKIRLFVRVFIWWQLKWEEWAKWEKQFKKTKDQSTKLEGDRRGGRLRSHYCLLMDREGKNNRSIVKCYWLYQNNCRMLDSSIASAVLIPKKGTWKEFVWFLLMRTLLSSLISADRRRGTDRWTAITDTEQWEYWEQIHSKTTSCV